MDLTGVRRDECSRSPRGTYTAVTVLTPVSSGAIQIELLSVQQDYSLCIRDHDRFQLRADACCHAVRLSDLLETSVGVAEHDAV